MAYTRVNWEDLPSTNTPRNATNLNKMDVGIKDNDDRIKVNEDKLSGTKPMGSIVVDDISGKNLFDINNILNAYIDSGGSKIAEASYARTIFVPCKASTTYTISKIASARFTVGYTTDIPANNVAVSGITTDNTATSITITTGANAKYLVAFVYHSSYDNNLNNILNSIQVELGGSATTYTSPINIIKEQNGYVKEDTTFYANDFKCRNLYNENTDIIGYIINQSGNIVVTAGYRTSQLIEVKPNNKYVVSRVFNSSSGGEDLMRVAYYQSDGTFIERPNSADNPWIITTPSNCYYVRVSYNYLKSTSTVNSQVQLEIGEATPYTPYKAFENEEIYSTNEIKIGKWIDGKDLYRKVIDFGALPNATTKGVAHNISNLGTVVNCYGYASISNTKLSINWYNGTNYITTFVTNTVVNIQTSNDRSSYTAYVIIEYTKTS